MPRTAAQTVALLLGGVCCALVGGCAPSEPPDAHTAADAAAAADPMAGYPKRTVVLLNLQRVLDEELAPEQRAESMKLIAELGVDDPQVRNQLAGLLAREDCPPELRAKVLGFLLDSGGAELAPHVVAVLPSLTGEDPTREALLDWLTRHPQPEVLSAIVKLWAAQSPQDPEEPRYRQVVERMTDKSWDRALLEAINTRGFNARGSALSILANRLETPALRERIAALRPRTDAAKTLRLFSQRFGYVPPTGREFYAAVMLYKNELHRFEEAAQLADWWRKGGGYRFRIRDFHLLSRLATDPLRQAKLRREQLIAEIGRSVKSRRHVRREPSSAGADDDYVDQFWLQTDRLDLADLWNLHLIDRMLQRKRMRLALEVMAERDRADRDHAWGGLVFYRRGQAEAILYQPEEGVGDEQYYIPSKRALTDQLDAMARFSAHFEKVQNASRAGPDARELNAAKAGNFYALLLTRVGRKEYAAHYYTPEGIVVSLGVYPFGDGG